MSIKRRKQYVNKLNEEVKKIAVLDYQQNGNASAIARKYGVPRTTLLEWIRQASSIRTSDPEVTSATIRAINDASSAVVRSIEQAAATRQEFLQQHYTHINTLFTALINKMKATLSDETKQPSLRDQAAALTALANFIKEFTPTEDQGATTINLLQQTVNK